MTLFQLIRTIESVALAQPTIRSVVENDVYRLNAIPDARYGVFAWLQGEHRTAWEEADTMVYAFTLFYVDRLTFDRKNEIHVQSTGIETLENILRALEQRGIFPEGQHSFRTFNERFSDECAGVYCTVSLQVPLDLVCADEFPDFNNDFNEDFKIF